MHRTLGEGSDPRWHIWALTVLGAVAYFEGSLDEAATVLRDAWSLARRHGQEDVGTSVLFTQGHIARVRGDFVTAQQRYAQVLGRWRRQGDGTGIANALLQVGALALQQGDLETAAARLEEALAAARAVGGREGVGIGLEGLGLVAEARGDPATARARFAEALTHYRDLGMRAGVTNVSVTLAGLALDAGEPAAARRHLRETLDDAQAQLAAGRRWLRVAGTTPPPRWFSLPRVLLSLACLAAAESQPERALRLAGAADALNPTWRAGPPGWPGTGAPDPLVGRADRWLAVARAALAEPAQEAAWTAGRTMPLELAVADALEAAAAPASARADADALRPSAAGAGPHTG